MGQAPALPRPIFSEDNPYWRPLVIEGVSADYQPRLTAQDYAHAWTWEADAPEREFASFLVCFWQGGVARYLWGRNMRARYRTLNLDCESMRIDPATHAT